MEIDEEVSEEIDSCEKLSQYIRNNFIDTMVEKGEINEMSIMYNKIDPIIPIITIKNKIAVHYYEENDEKMIFLRTKHKIKFEKFVSGFEYDKESFLCNLNLVILCNVDKLDFLLEDFINKILLQEIEGE